MSSSDFEGTTGNNNTDQSGDASNSTTYDSLLSSRDLRKISEDMKNDLNLVIRTMEEAIKFSLDEKTKASALKSLLFEKEEEVRKASEEITSIEKRISKQESIIADTEKELNNLKAAIDGIKEITTELDPFDAEKATGSLKGSLIKKQTEIEKVRAELNSSQKLKDIATRRLVEAEKSLEEAKRHCTDKMAKADTLAENVEKSVSHIVKTYNDVIAVAKELLMENLGSRYSSSQQQEYGFENRQSTTYNTNTKNEFKTSEYSKGDEEHLVT